MQISLPKFITAEYANQNYNKGAGESGKSTIAKQMKNIYLDGFTGDERLQYKEIIYSNIVSSMKTLIEACPKHGCNIEKASEVNTYRSNLWEFANIFIQRELQTTALAWPIWNLSPHTY